VRICGRQYPRKVDAPRALSGHKMTQFFRRIAAVWAPLAGMLVFLAFSQAQPGAAKDSATSKPVAVPITAALSESGVRFQFTPIITSGLSQPLFITHAGDERLFVAEKGGKVKIIQNGTVDSTPFLTQAVKSSLDSGLLGLAFEPNYTATGRLYIYYSNPSGEINLTRFTVSADNPNQVDPASATPLLSIPHTTSIHLGGWIGFGPDRFLYVTVGDGGIQRDPYCSAQNPSSLHGKILRLDVLNQITYTVPTTNSFAQDQAPEVWAWGLRNPHRGSFDRQTGDLYFGDVGHNGWEEIDYVPGGAAAGLNFGWNHWEGPAVYDSTTCPDNGPYVSPVISYSHATGGAAIGGYVYRGSSLPWLQGKYFYADWLAGKVFMAEPGAGGVFTTTLVSSEFGYASLASWGEDVSGNLYLADNMSNIVYRMNSTIPAAFIPVVVR
jgi:glucose/arabinose dehydrogenase